MCVMYGRYACVSACAGVYECMRTCVYVCIWSSICACACLHAYVNARGLCSLGGWNRTCVHTYAHEGARTFYTVPKTLAQL